MLSKSVLAQFTGTENYTRWSPLFPSVVMTDGAMYVAGNGGSHGAYWLMDAIASYQPGLKHLDMQFWKLRVCVEDRTALLTCVADTGLPPVVRQEIEYTDFDLPEIDLWVAPMGEGKHLVIMLPSEY